MNKWKIFYTLIFFTGPILLLLEIGIYRMTIIHTIIPIAVIIVVGFLSFLFNKDHYKRTYNVQGFFFPLMQNICSWGFIFCYLFMATNYFLGGNELKILKFQIKSKRSMPGLKGRRDERKPLVSIDYYGINKELVFKYEDMGEVKNADQVNLTIRTGFLGFDIIDDLDLVKKEK